MPEAFSWVQEHVVDMELTPPATPVSSVHSNSSFEVFLDPQSPEPVQGLQELNDDDGEQLPWNMSKSVCLSPSPGNSLSYQPVCASYGSQCMMT